MHCFLFCNVQYWVSQGKKWCDYCKIYIANNATSLRNHEFGQRHKESVAQRLATMRKDNIAKEREKQQAVKDFERIEVVSYLFEPIQLCFLRYVTPCQVLNVLTHT